MTCSRISRERDHLASSAAVEHRPNGDCADSESIHARRLFLPAVPESSGICREFVRSELDQWGIRAGTDDALLLASELCSNVVRHAGTPMIVSLFWDPLAQVLNVSVHDGSPLLPVVRGGDELAASGRGLRIVRTVARRWGVQPLDSGKVVWFELRVNDPLPNDDLAAERRAG